MPLFRATVIGFLLLGVLSCATGEPAPRGAQTGLMRAGEGEPTLAERYGLALALPMSEADFLEMIQSVPLPMRKAGERGSDIPFLKKPVRYPGFDMSVISHAYVIDGGYQPELRRNEMYWAYVSHDDQVLYIENEYSYAVY